MNTEKNSKILGKKLALYLFLPCLMLFCLSTCYFPCKCNCEKNIGCKILTLKMKSDNKVLMTKVFCSNKNIATDPILADSIENFQSKHFSDSTFISNKDSILHSENKKNIKCEDTQVLEKQDFFCHCAK